MINSGHIIHTKSKVESLVYIVYTFFTGVVCQARGDYADISFLKRTDKAGLQWVFPEEAEIQKTSLEQIMASGFEVSYLHSATRIRCNITKNLAEELNGELRTINTK